MRIRKNVKLSSVMPAEMLQTHVCQLNQSPWDVVSFSQEPNITSLNHQLGKKDPFTEDESLGGEIGNVKESATSLIERAEKVVSNIEDNNANNHSVFKREGRILCCSKNDELKQWQNTRIDAPTNGLVQKPEITTTAARRGRPRATKTGSTSIFNQRTEFYYYSGFGPFRGKKRGEGTENVRRCNQNNKPCFSQIDSGALAYTVEEVCEDDYNNGDIDHKTEDEYAEDENDKNDKKKKRKSVKARSLQSLM